ncbi:hypothetical protein KM043_007171 [Ampulex compressa]|nr:hypothetical protein KM043_007171 [Ampulex compressa]
MGNTNVEECLHLSNTYLQCVRWKRKPIWLPTAKSKIFRIPQRPVIPEDDYQELKRLYNNHRTYMNSLMYYMQEKLKQEEKRYDDASVKQAEEEDFLVCSEINNAWNEHVGLEREARFEKQMSQQIEQISIKLINKEQQDAMIKANIEEEVKKAKIQSEKFITAKNIDEAIEEALKTIVNHNTTLDFKGTISKE